MNLQEYTLKMTIAEKAGSLKLSGILAAGLGKVRDRISGVRRGDLEKQLRAVDERGFDVVVRAIFGDIAQHGASVVPIVAGVYAEKNRLHRDLGLPEVEVPQAEAQQGQL